ncbi:MAG: NIL domain-containing protein [Hydrococcus sp. Prado102]|nr:NIL domain-containing protein [Hydrococcus sp. Prado102]
MSLPNRDRKSNITQVRVRVSLSRDYRQEPLLSGLASNCSVSFNITQANLGNHPELEGQIDLELRGTIAQIRCGLAYLDLRSLKIVGKPNPDGDSWYY